MKVAEYRTVGQRMIGLAVTLRFSLIAGLLFCLSAMLTGRDAMAQPPVDSSKISPTLYFPSELAESTSRRELQARVPPMIQALASASAHTLAKELDHAEDLISALQTHAAFLKVLTLEDTQDQEAKRARDEIADDQTVLETAMDARLRQVPTNQIGSLGKYALLAKSAQHDAVHTLSPDAERYRGAVVPPTMQSIADAYDRIDSHLGRPKATTSTDTAARRTAIAVWNAAYDQAAPEEATLLAALVELENRDAAAQGYRNAADRKYYDLGLSGSLLNQTLAAVQAEAPVYHHYQEVLAHHAAVKLDVSPVFSTEVDLASAHGAPIALAKAQRMILAAFQPLGTDYTARFAQLLNPANGRLDLSGGAHRAHTGTSISAYDAPTALYYSGYDGSLRGVSTIAHEGGHAIHRELMNAADIPAYERSGPNYLFEGFAIFNELLLLDYATQTATTPIEKEYALERMLSKISLELFVSAEETTFERNLYTEASGNPLLDRTKIDSIYRASIAPFESWTTDDVGQSRGWMRKSLVFEDPLYLVNYLYASVIAVALYDQSRTDPDFAAKYEALLRRGFDAEPQVLLASVGVRLDDPTLIKPIAKLLESKTDELQRLYNDRDEH